MQYCLVRRCTQASAVARGQVASLAPPISCLQRDMGLCQSQRAECSALLDSFMERMQRLRQHAQQAVDRISQVRLPSLINKYHSLAKVLGRELRKLAATVVAAPRKQPSPLCCMHSTGRALQPAASRFFRSCGGCILSHSDCPAA